MSTSYKNIQVIINPAAGQPEPILNTLNRVFQKHEVHWDTSVILQHGDGEKWARAAVAAGVDLVASYGGDGTAVDVANGLVGTDIPQMVLPGGTANALAQELNIPLNLEAAAEVIFNSEVRKIDLGKTGDRYFMLRADMGVSAQIVDEASREMKDRFGVLAYGINALRAVTRNDRALYTLTLDGEVVEVEGTACLIANANKLGTLELTLSPQVDMTDGLLNVFVFNNLAESLLSAAAEIINLQDGAATTLQHWQVKEVSIKADPPQEVRGDGEVLGETPLTITIAPQAMSVLVPRASQEG